MPSDLEANDRATAQLQPYLDHEVELVRGAVEMVSTGRSRRVTIAGLRFGEQVIEMTRQPAASSGAIVEPIWHPTDSGCDVLVQPFEVRAPASPPVERSPWGRLAGYASAVLALLAMRIVRRPS